MLARLTVYLAAAALCLAQGVWPGKEWEKVRNPESIGYSTARLESVRSFVKTLDTSSVMVVVGGRVLFEHGDTARLSYVASVRKSVLAMLYGKYVAGGAIDLSKTIRQLGITDVSGLLPIEQEATIEHLITARSGVYHPPSNGGDDPHKPARGSVKPGTRFVYNNWDFNVAGTVFEKLTGKDIYQALEEDLARPIGMQDFDRSRQQKRGDGALSQHPAYHMWLSTRDMARLGHLMLRQGRWANRQLIPEWWVRRILRYVSPAPQATAPPFGWGYGYMWWVAPPETQGPFARAFTARGAYGQFITVLPELDMVVAHKTDPTQLPDGSNGQGRARMVGALEYGALLALLAAARGGM